MARALRILMIDDDDNDIALVRLAMRSLGKGHVLLSVRGGRQAIEFLEREKGEQHPAPDLLLVDLKMPCMNGLEFLAWLKDNPEFRATPAIVLSGSVLKQDIAEAYERGARGYLTKPVQYEDLLKKLRAMDAFWSGCEFTTMPSGDRLENR